MNWPSAKNGRSRLVVSAIGDVGRERDKERKSVSSSSPSFPHRNNFKFFFYLRSRACLLSVQNITFRVHVKGQIAYTVLPIQGPHWVNSKKAISLIVILSLLPTVRFHWPSKETFERILSNDVAITCCTVYNHNIVSPEVRRVVLSVHLDRGKTTGAWPSSWIIAAFASDMNFHHRPRNCKNGMMKENLSGFCVPIIGHPQGGETYSKTKNYGQIWTFYPRGGWNEGVFVFKCLATGEY